MSAPGFLGWDPDPANAVPGPALSSPARPAFRHGGGRCSRGPGRPRLAAGGSGLSPGGGGGGDCSPGGGGPRAQEAARGEAASPQAQLEAPLRAAGDPGQRHLRQSQEGHREVFGPSGEWGSPPPRGEGPPRLPTGGAGGGGRGHRDSPVREGASLEPPDRRLTLPPAPRDSGVSLSKHLLHPVCAYFGGFSPSSKVVFMICKHFATLGRWRSPSRARIQTEPWNALECLVALTLNRPTSWAESGCPPLPQQCPLGEGDPPPSHSYSSSPWCCCSCKGGWTPAP